MTDGDRSTGRPLLAVSGLSVFADGTDGRRTIVRDVDLEVAAGETIAIVGESGSGKSMLMKAVLRLLPQGTSSSGTVVFDGARVDELGERRLRPLRGRRVSLLLQDPFTMLNPLQTIRSTLAESLDRETGRRSRRQVAVEVERRLVEVGIDPAIAAKRPFQLSGGMRQRVAIAAALAADPELLIADEPTTALDAATQRDILKLLESLREQRNMAMVLITHDLRIAFETCSRVAVMYAGNVEEVAPAAEMRRDPRHPYTLGLMLAEAPVDHYAASLSPISGSVPKPDDVSGCCAFAPRCRWAADVCSADRPSLVEIGPERLSRCARLDAIVDDLDREGRRRVAVAARPPTAETPVLLEAADLRKAFHTAALAGPSSTHVALDGVTFAIHEGESVGLVGESGSGKTTIARSILGLSTPDSGLLRLDGLDISDYRTLSRPDTRAARRCVQVVFQDPYASLNPSLTVGAALAEAIAMRGDAVDPARELDEALDRVALPRGHAAKLPAALSGGERQRVSIARALCMRPRLLICDEPVAALDVSVQAQVLALLREIRADLGMAMLFITHDLAVVRQMTERILVLNHGVIVETGLTDTVLDEAQHAYTRSLLDAVPGQAPVY